MVSKLRSKKLLENVILEGSHGHHLNVPYKFSITKYWTGIPCFVMCCDKKYTVPLMKDSCLKHLI